VIEKRDTRKFLPKKARKEHMDLGGSIREECQVEKYE